MLEPNALNTIVELDENAPVGRLADRLPGARIVRLHAGDVLPAPAQIARLVVLGGRGTAYDEALAPVAGLLAAAARSGVPTLAVGLGAQLLAVAGGGAVEIAAPNGAESGIVDVRLRPDALADPLLGRVAAALCRDVVAVCDHRDAITDLPAGATWLASSVAYPFQAFRTGSALGVQFHPEVGPEAYAARIAPGLEAGQARAEWTAREDALTALLEELADGLLLSSSPHEAHTRDDSRV